MKIRLPESASGPILKFVGIGNFIIGFALLFDKSLNGSGLPFFLIIGGIVLYLLGRVK